jgi:uncharacterized protein (TIGR03067 family)
MRQSWLRHRGRLVRVITVATLAMAGLACTTGSSSRLLIQKSADAKLEGDNLLIQGTWTVVYNELKRTPTPQLKGALYIFRGDRFRLGDDPPGDSRFILDSTSDPKRIDFDDGEPPPILGIYRLNSNRLTICTGGPGEPRPTGFETTPLKGTILTRLERR